MNLKMLHFFSGVTISIFVGLHLVNHAYALLGAKAHIELMTHLRLIYRNTLAETLLLLAVGLQIFSGIRLFLQKRKLVVAFFDTLQIWTGLYLGVFLLFHIIAIFVGRYFLELDTNIYFGVAGLNSFPFNLFFIPYYGLAIISFFGHLSAVHSKKMKNKLFGFSPNKQSYGIFIFGLVLSLVILFGLTNGFQGFDISREYQLTTGI